MADFDFSTLITDRTAADAARAEELAARIVAGTASAEERSAFDTALKGAYGHSDMNRVGNAVAALADALNALGYGAGVSPKTDWAEGDIPTPEQLAAYLADVAAIRLTLGAAPSTPEPPESMDALTVEGANAIEQILSDTNQLITNMEAAFPRCGTLDSGMI